jgi:hypothetical protein
MASPRLEGEEGAMAHMTMPIPDDMARRKSVQEHIDELPMWADGTTLPSVCGRLEEAAEPRDRRGFAQFSTVGDRA